MKQSTLKTYLLEKIFGYLFLIEYKTAPLSRFVAIDNQLILPFQISYSTNL